MLTARLTRLVEEDVLEKRPYQTNPDRAAACYLYEASPVMATGGVDNVFVREEAAD